MRMKINKGGHTDMYNLDNDDLKVRHKRTLCSLHISVCKMIANDTHTVPNTHHVFVAY